MIVMRLSALVLFATALGLSVMPAQAGDTKTASGRAVLSVAQRHPAAVTKSTAKSPARKATRRVYRSARLVPPPPAYMPSILPELYYRQHTQQQAPAVADAALGEEAPEEPMKKYFYSATDEDVKPLQQRSGVSTWAPVSYRQRAN
ncbi:MAG: hypothetical protein K2W95_33990 [Candidatus Obscuribacterales bacterium]|nr:hypothetical protein [Candidatus Obscuribacterales bacterium]